MKTRIGSLLLALVCLLAFVPAVAEDAEPVKLTFWIDLGDKHGTTMTSLDEMPSFIELQKRMNVDFEFIHPASGQMAEAFNLMLASREFPDLIYYNWSGIDVNELIEDGMIVELTDLIPQYAPNYYATITGDPQALRQSTLDGRFYCLGFLQLDSGLRAGGPVIREDWLSALNLEAPVTVDDWYNVLCAFRDGDPNGNGLKDETPLIAQKGTGLETLLSWTSAFGVIQGFYMKDGEVAFGPVEEGFRQYLDTMAKWYAEGLIDPDFASTDGKSFAAKATGDLGGAWIGRVSGTLGNYIAVRAGDGTGFSLKGIAWPQTEDGHSYNIRGNMLQSFSMDGTVITTANKHVEESLRALDFVYSPEGHMLFNFGIEGESYTLVDGEPVYTELITNNPDGWSLSNAIAHYCRAATSFSMVQDIRYFRQTLAYDQQKNAVAAWGQSETGLLVPPIAFTSDESARLADIMADVNTLVSEWATKTIMGQISIDEFDKYVETIYEMNIEDALDIENAAYQRYIAE